MASPSRGKASGYHGYEPPADGGTHQLDLSDERQFEFLRSHLKLKSNGRSKHDRTILKALEPARQPQKRGRPARKGKPKPDTLQTVNTITGVGRTADGVIATAASAVVGGTSFTTLSLAVYDINNGQILADTQVGPVFNAGKYESIVVEARVAEPIGPLKFIFTVLYQTNPDETPVAFSTSVIVNEYALGLPVVVQPLVASGAPDTQLHIALATGRQKNGLDYWYDEKNRTKANLRLPYLGSQRFASPVLTPHPANFVAKLLLFSPESGGAAVANAATMAALQDLVTANGTLLNWTLQWNPRTVFDRSAQFGQAAWKKGATVIPVFMAGIRTQTSGTTYVWVTVGNVGAEDVTAGIYELPSVVYLWQ